MKPNKAVAFPLWACLRRPDGDLVTVVMWTSWPCSDLSVPTETDSDRAPYLTGCRLNNPELLHRRGSGSVLPRGHTHPSLPSPEPEVIKAEPLDWICTLEENQDGGTLQKLCVQCGVTAVTRARLLFPGKHRCSFDNRRVNRDRRQITATPTHRELLRPDCPAAARCGLHVATKNTKIRRLLPKFIPTRSQMWTKKSENIFSKRQTVFQLKYPFTFWFF